MYLLLRDPRGALTSLDLGTVPVWDLGLEQRAADKVPGLQGAAIAVILSAPINGMMVKLYLDLLDTRSKGDELDQVLKVGLPVGTRSGDKARFAEALKILSMAGLPTKDVDEVIAQSAAFIDGFWTFRDAMWGTEQPLADMGVLGRHTNAVSKYSWVLSRSRNGSLFTPAVEAAAGMGAAPGAGYAASAPVAAPPAAVDPLAGGLGPPPGTEKKPTKAGPRKSGEVDPLI